MGKMKHSCRILVALLGLLPLFVFAQLPSLDAQLFHNTSPSSETNAVGDEGQRRPNGEEAHTLRLGLLGQAARLFADGDVWIDRGTQQPENGYKFSGKFLDPETGLYDFGARFYDPKTSLWLGVDPPATEGPGYLAGSPMSASLYNYANQSPLAYVDPDGRRPDQACGNCTNGAASRPMTPFEQKYNDEVVYAEENAKKVKETEATIFGPIFGAIDIATDFIPAKKGLVFFKYAYKGARLAQQAVNTDPTNPEQLAELGSMGIGLTKGALADGKLQNKSSSACPGGQCQNGACFVAGTLVETSEGPKPIEEIQVGDLALSQDIENRETVWVSLSDTYETNSDWDPFVEAHRAFEPDNFREPGKDDIVWVFGEKGYDTFASALLPGDRFSFQGRVFVADQDPITEELFASYSGLQLNEVANTFVRQTETLIDLVVRDKNGNQSTITGTPEHPFFIPVLNKYIELRELKEGMLLFSVHDINVFVLSIDIDFVHTPVFNFEVKNQHNYFIVSNENEILTHNACKPLALNKAPADVQNRLAELEGTYSGRGMQKFRGNDQTVFQNRPDPNTGQPPLPLGGDYLEIYVTNNRGDGRRLIYDKNTDKVYYSSEHYDQPSNVWYEIINPYKSLEQGQYPAFYNK